MTVVRSVQARFEAFCQRRRAPSSGSVKTNQSVGAPPPPPPELLLEELDELLEELLDEADVIVWLSTAE